MSLQTTSSGCFRPVGTKSFGRIRQKPEAFDQQPVEAAATISACLAAWRADDGAEWPAGAMRAFDWFLGENDLQTALIDPDTAAVRMASIRIEPMRTRVQNRCCRIFSVSWRYGSSSALLR